MPPVQGSSALPVDTNGHEQWGTYELGATKFWLPAGKKIHPSSDIWSLYATLALQGAAGIAEVGQLEDATHADGHAGMPALVVRKDAAAATASADGKYGFLVVGGDGGLWVRHSQPLPAGTANIGDVDVLTLPALPAGTNNIGDVDVLTLPADPLGTNADAVVAAGAVGSLSAKLRRLTTDIGALILQLPAALSGGGNLKSLKYLLGAAAAEEAARTIGGVSATAPHTGVAAVAGNSFSLALTAADPIPSGSDITGASGATLASTDFAIRNTSSHWVVIPMGGWTRLRIAMRTSTAFDQTVNVVVYQVATASILGYSKIGGFALPLTSINFGLDAETGGLNQVVGGATAADNAIYAIPAFKGGAAFIALLLSAPVGPGAGELNLWITRNRF